MCIKRRTCTVCRHARSAAVTRAVFTAKRLLLFTSVADIGTVWLLLLYGFFLDSIQTTPVLQCLSSLRMSERSLAFTSQSVPDAALRKAGGCSSGTAALGVLMSAETLLISVK